MLTHSNADQTACLLMVYLKVPRVTKGNKLCVFSSLRSFLPFLSPSSFIPPFIPPFLLASDILTLGMRIYTKCRLCSRHHESPKVANCLGENSPPLLSLLFFPPLSSPSSSPPLSSSSSPPPQPSPPPSPTSTLCFCPGESSCTYT